MSITKLRTRVNPNIDYLTLLNLTHNWIPNHQMIRPTLEVFNKKTLLNNHINNDWSSMKDYVLYSVFDQDPKINQEGKYYIDQTILNVNFEWVFKPAQFPYNVPTNSNHYILWNYSNDFFTETNERFVSDEDINKIILDSIIKINENSSTDNIEFIWYKNPKPSILDFFHVQVFFKL